MTSLPPPTTEKAEENDVYDDEFVARRMQEEDDESLALALQMSMERPAPPTLAEPLPPPRSLQAVTSPNNPARTAAASMLDRFSRFLTGGGPSAASTQPSSSQDDDHDVEEEDEYSDDDDNHQIGEAQNMTDLQRRRLRVERYVARKQRELADVFHVMEVIVPEMPVPISNVFVVRTPDGNSLTLSRTSTLGPGTVIWVPYDGEPVFAPHSLHQSLSIEQVSNDRESAFLDFYRFHPSEIETAVKIIMGDRPFGGCRLVERLEGIFVVNAVIPSDDVATTHTLRAGDLLVSCNEQPIESLGKLLAMVSSSRLGAMISVRALRPRVPFVRCPLGHWVRRIDEHRAMEITQECNKCKRAWGKFSCEECRYEVCGPCYQAVWLASKPRKPIPVNNTAPFVEAPVGTMLSFNESDVGTKILLFWNSTGEWWVGQITAWDAARGHTVRYETPNGGMAQETVYDFEVREYRVLLEAELKSPVTGFHKAILGSDGDEGIKLFGVRSPQYENTAPFVGDLLGLDVDGGGGTMPGPTKIESDEDDDNGKVASSLPVVAPHQEDDKVTLSEEEFALLNKLRDG